MCMYVCLCVGGGDFLKRLFRPWSITESHVLRFCFVWGNVRNTSVFRYPGFEVYVLNTLATQRKNSSSSNYSTITYTYYTRMSVQERLCAASSAAGRPGTRPTGRITAPTQTSIRRRTSPTTANTAASSTRRMTSTVRKREREIANIYCV